MVPGSDSMRCWLDRFTKCKTLSICWGVGGICWGMGNLDMVVV